MLRKLSPESQQILQAAQNIARRYDQEYVDAEHLLLAIAEKNDTPAAQALLKCGAPHDKIRANIEKVIKQNPSQTLVLGRLSATLNFRNVVTRAIEIAEARSAPSVEPEHLLVALSMEEQSLATQALEALGVDTGRIEAALADRK